MRLLHLTCLITALASLSGCGCSSDTQGSSKAKPATVSGVSATIDGEAIKVSHGVAFSDYGAEVSLLFTDFAISCEDARRLLNKRNGHNILLKASRRVQTDGSYPYQLNQVGLFPQSDDLKDPTTLDWTPATDADGLSGSLDLKRTLPASEVFESPQRELTVKGSFKVPYCGVRYTPEHPPRPQKDLNLTLTGNAFPINAAILRPHRRESGRWSLWLGNYPATCEKVSHGSPLSVQMDFREDGRVSFMHLYGEALNPQLNYNGSAQEPHVVVSPASGFPESGEVSLTLKGHMEGLGHKLEASGAVSAIVCPAD